jgi:hypothetical protein
MHNAIAPAIELAKRQGNRALFFAKKYSPEILTGTGIVAGVVAGFMGAKATLKLEALVADLEMALEQHRQLRFHTTEEQYTRMAYIRDITGDYAIATAKIAKNYAPTITMASAATVCILGAHGIMKRRTVTVIAAYEALERVYNGYRERVIEEFGEEKDRDYRLGIRDGKTHILTNDETGVKHKVTEATIDPTVPSQYARFFDEQSADFNKRTEDNLTFLNAQQRFANYRLNRDGFLFLNDVYDMLGLPKTAAGQVVGWLSDKHDEFNDQPADHFVDFGIYDPRDTKSRQFVNGNEKYILLDFNPDGLIWDRI